MQTKIHNVGGVLHIEGADPGKPYDVCDLLDKHDISLCAMSEVRWKGQGTFEAQDFLYIFSGLPEDAPVSLHGVAFALNPKMQQAWRAAGSYVNYHSERLLEIKVRIEDRTFRVISVYAPTFRAPEIEKDKFYDDLRSLTGKCRACEELVIMGDFNARVGTRTSDRQGPDDMDTDEQSSDIVVGDFGLPELNDNGRLLLDFCRSQRGKPLRVMDTFFQHKTYGTWQHNRTKQWHHIDHVLLSSDTAAMCMDVCVMPGLDFDSDHRLVRLDLRITRKCKQWWGRRHLQTMESKGRITALNVARLTDKDVVQSLNDNIESNIGEGILNNLSLWSKDVRSTAETVIGTQERKRRPQWQLDNAEELARLSKIKQEAFAQFQAHPEKETEYRRICRENRKQVQSILNQWWSTQAEAIQQAVNRKEPNHQYQGFRQLRKVFHSGKRAPAKVKDKKGNLLESRTDRVHRWREHFQNLLNVDAPLNEDMLPQIKRLPVQNVLAELPIFAETLAAVKSLKKGKATGPDGLPAEVLQVLSYPVLRSLHEHLCQLWIGCQDIPGEWNDAYLIPMPKKGEKKKKEI